MEEILIKEKRYSGQYVAVKDLNNPGIIACGRDPKEVYEEAIKKKCPEPMIVFIPDKNMVQIYFEGVNQWSL